MNIPHLNLSRLPNSTSASAGSHHTGNAGGSGSASLGASVGGGGMASQGRAIPNAEPALTRHRGGSTNNASGGPVGSPRPPHSSSNTPLPSPRQTTMYPSAATGASSVGPPPNVYSSSLARRGAELAGVLDFDVMRCNDVYKLQRKVIETAERLVRAERWYEEQLRDRSSYYHYRLNYLNKYISEVEMASAPRNINFSSAANRSSSLLSRPTGSGENPSGYISRGPASGMSTVAGRQSPYYTGTNATTGNSGAERRPTAVTASPIGSASRPSSMPSPLGTGGANTGLAAAERAANSKAFTAMIQSVLNRDRGDLQGEKDRRRRVPGSGSSPHSGGTPLKYTSTAAAYDRGSTNNVGSGGDEDVGTGTNIPKRRTASKPTIRRHSVGGGGGGGGGGSNPSSGATTPTRRHQPQLQLLHQKRRGSVGSSSSVFSNNSAKSGSSSSSRKVRKTSTPGKGKRRHTSPLTTAAGGKDSTGSENGVSTPGSGNGANPYKGTGPHNPNEVYFTSKSRAGAGYSSLNSSGDGVNRLMDSQGGGEVKRGSDMKPQPPSYSANSSLDGHHGNTKFLPNKSERSDEGSGRGGEDRSTTPLRKR